MSRPTIRLRDLKRGQSILLEEELAIEILDHQLNVALLLLPSPIDGGVKLVTANEEPDVAHQYAEANGVTFSRVLTPNLAPVAPRAT